MLKIDFVNKIYFRTNLAIISGRELTISRIFNDQDKNRPVSVINFNHLEAGRKCPMVAIIIPTNWRTVGQKLAEGKSTFFDVTDIHLDARDMVYIIR